jgi:hypothetical protein
MAAELVDPKRFKADGNAGGVGGGPLVATIGSQPVAWQALVNITRMFDPSLYQRRTMNAKAARLHGLGAPLEYPVGNTMDDFNIKAGDLLFEETNAGANHYGIQTASVKNNMVFAAFNGLPNTQAVRYSGVALSDAIQGPASHQGSNQRHVSAAIAGMQSVMCYDQTVNVGEPLMWAFPPKTPGADPRPLIVSTPGSNKFTAVVVPYRPDSLGYHNPTHRLIRAMRNEADFGQATASSYLVARDAARMVSMRKLLQIEADLVANGDVEDAKKALIEAAGPEIQISASTVNALVAKLGASFDVDEKYRARVGLKMLAEQMISTLNDKITQETRARIIGRAASQPVGGRIAVALAACS